MLELYYNFFDEYCDDDKFEELEMDTDSLYLALAHKNLCNCIRPAKKEEWENLRENDCDVSFRADASHNFSPEHVAQSIRSTINESQDP